MQRKSTFLIAVIWVVLAVLVGWGLYQASRPVPVVLQGQMDAQTVDIAAKIAGRVKAIYVKEGDQIVVGTPIMQLEDPEIDAKRKQAQGAQDAADAMLQKAEQGARPQEIEMAKHKWQQAQAAAVLGQKTFQRVDKLAQEGLLSQQSRDEAYANYAATRDQAAAAQAQYELARAGARSEDKAAALAQAKQVEGVMDEVGIAEAESHLQSPVAGEVTQVLSKVGGITPQGVPIITVVDLSDQWVVLNVREDYIAQFSLGATFEGTLPALASTELAQPITFTVYASSVLPDFATWRATRNSSGFDLKTFEVKARPLVPIKGMRPGMSVLVHL
ncbi:efflux RND transporter periplasmic adaptor subunit [Denitrificimonas sp. JX-1]|uniref:Efflux RND transporter periplasmic adaptor subunit n=1 Tax=Denitrificimonas halotolerans TaxID=3098930 RepID=A0ABU5GTH5_9GAMM|nr:efflux RND transporter periplasmic adaptor subunit [Denitrificimonas sp. JX-1]MDY7220296.1 efflux RND transporter periplasmic adaptor subunit [Denitrificimonas sp. JX-1]